MKNLAFSSLLVLGLMCAQGKSDAAEINNFVHGNSCFNASAGTSLNYSQWGPYNNSNTGITVNCPIGLPQQNYTSIKYSVTGWSRNNSANKLSCTFSTTGNTGGALASSTATVPYNLNSAQNGNGQTFPTPNITPWPYLTCYIPPSENGWLSYLSTILYRAYY